ncbi:MAG: hypothetical protein WAM78_06000 [Candidatus Sulfotelmatobacter sp.]
MTTRKYQSFASALHICLLATITLYVTCPSARAGTATLEREKSLSTQKFFCHTGYDPHQCEQHIAELKAVLLQLPVASPKRWTWIIVRSEDWQPLVQSLHLPPQSPAFTALALRETFLEDALFFSQPGRTQELVMLLKTPFAQLLSVVVSHELGHAICHNGDEAAANRIAEQLRSGKPPDCFDTGTQKPLGPIDELILHNQSPGFPHLH